MMSAMDANDYAAEIERRLPDREGLVEIRKQLNLDGSLDPTDRANLSERVGTYLLDMDRSGLTEDESPDTV